MSGIALDIARELIMVDTHDGGETEAAELLRAIFANRNISTTIIEPEPERGNVVAILPGGPEAGLLLHSHLDTAGFGKIEQWKHSPLSGQVDNGKLYGRGALDCKGLAAVHTEVMVRVHALDLPLRRPLVLLASAGEETGGTLGSQYLIANNDDIARCGHVLGEGGGYPLIDRSPFRYAVQTGEFGRFEFPTGNDGASLWKGLIRSQIAGLFQALREGTYSPELCRPSAIMGHRKGHCNRTL